MTITSPCFPDGRQTTSWRITAVCVHPERSISIHKLYAEVFEAPKRVYRGLIDLHRIATAPPRPDLVDDRRVVSLSV